MWRVAATSGNERARARDRASFQPVVDDMYAVRSAWLSLEKRIIILKRGTLEKDIAFKGEFAILQS